MRFIAMLDVDEYARLTFDIEMGRCPNPLRFRSLAGIPIRIDLQNPAGYHTSIHTMPSRPTMAGLLTVEGRFVVSREGGP